MNNVNFTIFLVLRAHNSFKWKHFSTSEAYSCATNCHSLAALILITVQNKGEETTHSLPYGTNGAGYNFCF
jgi:hypothetical protein